MTRSIVFVKTRHSYGSYSDFWKLVELSRFEVCFVDEIDLFRDALYIVTPINGEFRPKIAAEKEKLSGAKPQARLVAWLLERPDENLVPGPDILKANADEIMGLVDEAWVSDGHFASLDPRYTHVPMGSHPGLREGGPGPERYAICHISARFPRRCPILDPILTDYKGSVGPNGWGDARARTLNSSRAIVNVHKTPAPIGEPIRFAIAAAYKLPLITETLADPRPMVDGVHFISSSAGVLRDKVRQALARPDLSEFGERLHKLLCVDNTFGEYVREAATRPLRGDGGKE